MNADAASLENLRDIVEPEVVSWWPLAGGWYVLVAILLTAIAVASYRAWRRWRAAAYRRAALQELRTTADVAQISEILKRAALVAYPRADVAPLAEEAWSEWLERTADEKLPPAVRATLVQGVFAKTPQTDVEPLMAFAERWIRHHKSPLADG